MEKEYYTVTEAAEKLHYGERTIRDWCNQGKLKGAFKIGNARKWLIPFNALQLASNNTKEEERFKEQQPKEILDTSLRPSDDLYKDKLHHDRIIFKELNAILSEKDVFAITYKIEVGNTLADVMTWKIDKFFYFANLDATYQYVIKGVQERYSEFLTTLDKWYRFVCHNFFTYYNKDETELHNLKKSRDIEDGAEWEEYIKEYREQEAILHKLTDEFHKAYKAYRSAITEYLLI